ncbi:MAG: Fe-S cluster assembly transcription factor [Burkholderiales bacterium]|jgi:Rrf2 family iron-sulfur cluster assembly transcriptional regulator|nr:Fe-S cluster assembly transcription factor [Burkholderiales bacterium]
MRLTTKGRFAVTAVLDVTLYGAQGPVTLAAISERQDISLSYLEQLFGKLRRCGLVESVRGPGGGYNLTKPPSQISVADIIFAVDEPIDATRCGGRGNCQHEQEHCMTHDLWSGLTSHIFNFMHAVTLEQLAEQQRSKERRTPVERPVIIQDLSEIREPTLI